MCGCVVVVEPWFEQYVRDDRPARGSSNDEDHVLVCFGSRLRNDVLDDFLCLCIGTQVMM